MTNQHEGVNSGENETSPSSQDDTNIQSDSDAGTGDDANYSDDQNSTGRATDDTSEDDSEEGKSIPYERFREVNEQKKQLDETLRQIMPYARYSYSLQQAQEKNPEFAQAFKTALEKLQNNETLNKKDKEALGEAEDLQDKDNQNKSESYDPEKLNKVVEEVLTRKEQEQLRKQYEEEQDKNISKFFDSVPELKPDPNNAPEKEAEKKKLASRVDTFAEAYHRDEHGDEASRIPISSETYKKAYNHVTGKSIEEAEQEGESRGVYRALNGRNGSLSPGNGNNSDSKYRKNDDSSTVSHSLTVRSEARLRELRAKGYNV